MNADSEIDNAQPAMSREATHYHGIGISRGEAGPCKVRVFRPGRLTYEELPLHSPRHSPDGFQWGYSGSGPAELARQLLWDVLGEEPHPATYQAFKASYVAGWPMHLGTCWAITDLEIRAWLHQWWEQNHHHPTTIQTQEEYDELKLPREATP